MSKRREQLERGLEQLRRFLEIFFREHRPPTSDHIRQEIKAIAVLRQIPLELNLPYPPLPKDEPFFYILGERYGRYDDILPEAIELYVLPADQDTQKQIDRKLTLEKFQQ